MHIFSGGSKLQIARSQLSDSGTYSCVASNTEGKARKSYHLTIQGTTILPQHIVVSLWYHYNNHSCIFFIICTEGSVLIFSMIQCS